MIVALNTDHFLLLESVAGSFVEEIVAIGEIGGIFAALRIVGFGPGFSDVFFIFHIHPRNIFFIMFMLLAPGLLEFIARCQSFTTCLLLQLLYDEKC
jgi:hypothetical protein